MALAAYSWLALPLAPAVVAHDGAPSGEDGCVRIGAVESREALRVPTRAEPLHEADGERRGSLIRDDAPTVDHVGVVPALAADDAVQVTQRNAVQRRGDADGVL